METKTHSILTPSEGMVIYNKVNGTYSDGDVYVGRLDSPENYEERPYTEYEAWVAERDAQVKR